MLQWNNIMLTEFIVVTLLLLGLGLVKLPRFLMKKKLQAGFPWGYYPDRVPKADPGFYADDNTNFLHDVGTEFAGMEGFGDFGEFSGFGEMGEFGGGFSHGE
ncbi:MAG: hypothetical protein K2X81_12700 [Candidatus Obscuribacterales bacterium]|nr:hypothetical protein [Candidatus Obscuribacterales bacterium]